MTQLQEHPGNRVGGNDLPSDNLVPMQMDTLVNKRVSVRGTPPRSWSFNPGLAMFKGQRWLAVRSDRNDTKLIKKGCIDERTAGLVRLTESGKTIGVQKTLRGLEANVPCINIEDPRLFVHDDGLFMVYNTPTKVDRKHRFLVIRTYLAEIDVSDVEHPVTLWRRELNTNDMRLARIEKNWTPFVYQDELHFIEQTNPPIVMRLDRVDLRQARRAAALQPGKRQRALTLHRVSQELDEPVQDSNLALPWSGGTPAIYEESLGEYVSFFHFFTSPEEKKLHRRYYAGFYTFAGEPPFSIRQYVPHPLVLAPVSKEIHPYSYVFFPAGLVDEQDAYLMSYGEADRVVGIARIDKEELFSQLKQVEADEP